MEKLAKLLVAIVICEGVGMMASVFTLTSISTWYQYLNKPVFIPPSSVFAPVWIILYALMAISWYLALEVKSKTSRNEYSYYFFVQLLLNFIWPVAFFYFHFLSISLTVIFALLFVILLLIFKAWRISRPAAILLVPYLLWVGFATYLNMMVVFLNR